jgi:hypothetical protein
VGFLVKKRRNLDFRASLLAIDTFAQRKLSYCCHPEQGEEPAFGFVVERIEAAVAVIHFRFTHPWR